jgi:hypothetical protein
MNSRNTHIRCGHCQGYHDSIERVRACSVAGGRGLTMQTIEDAIEALDTGEGDARRLFDAIAIANGSRRYDVVRELTERLVRLADPTERSLWQFREAVYTGATAMLSESNLDSLPRDLDRTRSEIRSWRPEVGAQVDDHLEQVDIDLRRLSLVIADGTPSSMTSACGRLRRFDLPGLGREAATAALASRVDDPVALTTRAGASLDLGDLDWAAGDLAVAWPLSSTFHAPNTLSRLEVMKKHYLLAIEWADVANERDGDGTAGLLAKVKAARLGGFESIYEATIERLEALGGRKRASSEMWTDVLLAGELRRTGDYGAAIRLLDPLVEKSYTPARRLLLEIRGAQRMVAA